MMKAFLLSPEGPRIVEHERPRPRAGEVLLRVRACALNRVDLMMVRGHVHGAAGGVGAVLGVECAGEVVELGEGVTQLRAGDRVMCSGAGAFAEFALVAAERALPIPAAMEFEQAAAMPVALQTMHDAIVSNGRLERGQSVLVQGASSGVGLMALQIAKLLGASVVLGSSTDAERRSRLCEFGADVAFDSRDATWVEQALAATQGKGVDLLVDQVAGPLFAQNMQATRVGGTIVNVGRLGGSRAEFDFDLHALRRIHYVGVTFRTRTRAELRAVAERTRDGLWAALSEGQLRMPVDRVFAFDEVEAALSHMRQNRHFGKIVLRV
jgi:NADPH2:quinone reductase